LKTHLKNFLIN